VSTSKKDRQKCFKEKKTYLARPALLGAHDAGISNFFAPDLPTNSSTTCLAIYFMVNESY